MTQIFKTKSAMSRVANTIAKEIIEALSIYSDSKYEVELDKHIDDRINLICSESKHGLLTGSAIETIQGVFHKYHDKYQLLYGLGTKQIYNVDHNFWYSIPTLEINIRMINIFR